MRLVINIQFQCADARHRQSNGENSTDCEMLTVRMCACECACAVQCPHNTRELSVAPFGIIKNSELSGAPTEDNE